MSNISLMFGFGTVACMSVGVLISRLLSRESEMQKVLIPPGTSYERVPEQLRTAYRDGHYWFQVPPVQTVNWDWRSWMNWILTSGAFHDGLGNVLPATALLLAAEIGVLERVVEQAVE